MKYEHFFVTDEEGNKLLAVKIMSKFYVINPNYFWRPVEKVPEGKILEKYRPVEGSRLYVLLSEFFKLTEEVKWETIDEGIEEALEDATVEEGHLIVPYWMSLVLIYKWMDDISKILYERPAPMSMKYFVNRVNTMMGV